jgi:hypothetical protein
MREKSRRAMPGSISELMAALSPNRRILRAHAMQRPA